MTQLLPSVLATRGGDGACTMTHEKDKGEVSLQVKELMPRETWRHTVNLRYAEEAWPPGLGRLQGGDGTP